MTPSSATKIPNVRLNNGVEIPILGLGVYQSHPGEETKTAVKLALAAGYRHIDTARAYRNERDVGAAIRESGIARKEVFVTTKLWNNDHGYDTTLRAFDQSLKELGFDYLDLYLVHWPVEGLRHDTWRAMESLAKSGRCRAVGVSNYTVRHLEELLARSSLVPAMNQVELSPFLTQVELRKYSKAKGIQIEAYGPLTQGKKLGNTTVTQIASKLGRTPAQVLLRWGIEHELVVIPKSIKKPRIEENSAIFDFQIPPEDMAALDRLDERYRTSWDPTDAP